MRWSLIVLSLFVLVVAPFQVSGQSKLKNGDYYYKVKSYDRAIRLYKRELRKKPGNVNIYYNIIDCYLKSNIDKVEALPYVEKVLEIERTPKVVLNHGILLFYTEQFLKAMRELEWVKIHTEQGSEEYEQAQRFLRWIMNAIAYTNNPVEVDFINLGKGINTNKSELNPYVTLQEERLVYSSNKRYLSKVGINYFNVCLSLRNKNNWQKGKILGSSINSAYDEIVAGYSPDGNSLFVFHNRDNSERISYADYVGKGRFDDLQNFVAPIDKKGGEFGVWLSSSKDTLVYAAENEKGDTDIYYALKLPSGMYGKSRAMPGSVNSAYDEDFPVLTDGGKRIYFSSNGANSMGGHDLFYSDWDDRLKEWAEPINLGYPINDKYDNYSISLTKGNRYAYVSAVRPEGYGERDIYKVLFKHVDAPVLILKCTTLLQTDTGNVVPSYLLRIEVSDASSSKKVGSYRSSSDSAKFVMALEPGDYKVSFWRDNSNVFSTALVVPEMWYTSEAFKYEFIIPKNNDEER